jgi:hypothetical protein
MRTSFVPSDTACGIDPPPQDRWPTWDEAKFAVPPDGARIVIERK